jgi:hypothetical protein
VELKSAIIELAIFTHQRSEYLMSMEVPSEPTPGETKLVLDSILETLRDVKSDMATKEFVGNKFTVFNDRVERIETDMTKLNADTVRATDELKLMITDRINQVVSDFDEEQLELHKRIDDIIMTKEELEKQRRGRSLAVYMAILGAGLSLLVSIATAIIVNSITP